VEQARTRHDDPDDERLRNMTAALRFAEALHEAGRRRQSS
jgi:hypothetical protein|tara:strand:+ start:1137 stop:1256 length:120 start_codon:yes stop_codon:yes gene_type:complete